MKTQYVAFPILIKFIVNERVHTVETFKKFGNYSRELSGDVKAVIADTELEAKTRLFSSVKKFILLNFTENNTNVRPENFELTYNTSEVKDGEFWSSRDLRMFKKLSD